jgi:hypothetical protein
MTIGIEHLFTNFGRSRFCEQDVFVNMSELEMVETALENLKRDTGITGNWTREPHHLFDGTLLLTIGKDRIAFSVLLKKELKPHQLPEVIRHLNQNDPALIVAGRLLPKVREELRRNQLSYLEANGNFHYRSGQTWIFLDSNPSLPISQNLKNRAFTKTGLKLVFEILQDPEFLKLPYRTIASQTKTSVGNVVNVLSGLKQAGFLMPIRKNEWLLQNKKALILRWAESYAQNLKPALKMGTFRFLKDEPHWTKIPLTENQTYWGGEPGADLLTHYLTPTEFTLYTGESRSELMKKYRLVPNEKGNVFIFEKFWSGGSTPNSAAPTLVVYADLVATEDSRCIEAASRIYDEYLQD